MSEKAPDTIAFGHYELDVTRGELLRDGASVRLEPQAFDLIAYLARHPGEVVSRDTLIEHVWKGRIVSDSAISSCIAAARAALGDDGTAQRIIRTVPRRGIRFEAAIRSAAPEPRSEGLPLPDKPSVAVLPFLNMSGDPEQTYFSDGITDDIITDLSRYEDLLVIARHSSFAYRGGDRTPSQIARELGVQYIAHGSVRRAGARIRVTAQLIDPTAGRQLWAERFDRELTDIFEVQDEIAAVIVNTLAGRIAHEQYRRSMVKSADAVNAYDHVLRAVELNFRTTRETNQRARTEAEAALDLDPGNARAHAIVGWSHIADVSNAWSEDVERSFDLAHQAAMAAVGADDREPYGHSVLAWVWQWRDRRHDLALEAHDRAVSLNPGSASYRSFRAFSLTYAGQPERAIRELDVTMRLNPHHPALYVLFYGRALFNLKRYEDARPYLERARIAMPGHANALALVAACHAALGRMDDARVCVADVLSASPAYTLDHAHRLLPFAQEEDRAHFLAWLEKAGLPARGPA